MKTIGYRIMEFGKFNWDDVVIALQIYKEAYGNIDVPLDFVLDEATMDLNLGFDVDDGRLEGLLLGHAVESLRIGDIDGFEDPERRSILDGLGFQWGDLSKYQRYRFPPMMVRSF